MTLYIFDKDVNGKSNCTLIALHFPDALAPLAAITAPPREIERLRPWGYESAPCFVHRVTSSHTTLTFITTCRRYRVF